MDFRYQYRESKLSETVSIELEARTGTVRYVHNSSKAEAVNKQLKLKTPSELLQHARPWLDCVDRTYIVDKDFDVGARDTKLVAHRYCFGYPILDSRASVTLNSRTGELIFASFNPPHVPNPAPVTISAVGAESIARLTLLESFPEAAFFATFWVSSPLFVRVGRYRDPTVSGEFFYGGLTPVFEKVSDWEIGDFVGDTRLCYGVGFMLDPAFGPGSLYIDANNGRLCERFID